MLRLDTPAGVVATRAGTRDGLLAVGVTRTARRIGDATLLLPDLPDNEATGALVRHTGRCVGRLTRTVPPDGSVGRAT